MDSNSLVQKSTSSSIATYANRLSEDLDSNSLVQKSISSSIVSSANRLSEDLDPNSLVQKSTSSSVVSFANRLSEDLDPNSLVQSQYPRLSSPLPTACLRTWIPTPLSRNVHPHLLLHSTMLIRKCYPLDFSSAVGSLFVPTPPHMRRQRRQGKQ